MCIYIEGGEKRLETGSDTQQTVRLTSPSLETGHPDEGDCLLKLHGGSTQNSYDLVTHC